MSIPLIQAPLPFERHTIRSGPISRSGFQDYGVIFTSREGVSPSDFHTADLLGAVIEVIELRDKGEANRFFTILGGYYCDSEPGGRKKEVAISHIFGVAADASLGFGLQPGNHCLVDEWEMKDLSGGSRKNMMDERDKGGDGWTFIVNFKPSRAQYPFSGKSIAISRECPQLTSLVVSQGASEETTLVAEAIVTTLHGPVRGYRWTWGDGSAAEETITPTANHVYQRASGQDQAFTITVASIGPDGCESSLTQVFTVSGHCPVVLVGSTELFYPDDIHAEALVELAGGHLAGMTYRWNWGDGSELEETPRPQATHRYVRKTEVSVFKLEITSFGPGTCGANLSTVFSVAAKPCPEITSLNPGPGEMVGNVFVVPFSATVIRGQADSYLWNWGDGSDATTTQRPEATHQFVPAAGAPTTRKVTVTAIGPGSACESSASVEVVIPGQCPMVSIKATMGEVTETTAEVSLALNHIGPAPDSWTIHWGDGTSPESVVGLRATHVFVRPAGDQQTMSISATANGPGSCSDQATTSVVIPGACPALSNLEIVWEEQLANAWVLSATVSMSGPAPDHLVWDWGDGSAPEQSQATTLQHSYTAKPGETQARRLRVSAQGPAPCESTAEIDIEVPALPCPILQQLKVSPGPVEGNKQTFTFSAAYEGVTPGRFRWNWGDGSAEETTADASASHAFALKPGEDASYEVQLFSDGPGVCKSATHATVSLVAYCPLPGELSLLVQAASGSGISVDGNLTVTGPAPTRYVWDWGDGSAPTETTQPSASHTYAEKPGFAQQYTVVVTVKGPGVCADRSRSQEIVLPASCPVFQGITATEVSLSETSVVYQFDLPGTGAADSYVWDFGDGSAPETSASPSIRHEYARWAGQTPSFAVQVQANGPGSCSSQSMGNVMIPEPDICPIISRIDTYTALETVDSVSIGFIPVTLQGFPIEYTWDFGDGSAPLTTSDAEVIHEYQRGSGSAFEVKVSSKGPKVCVANQSVHVSVKQTEACPEIGALALSGKAGAQAGEYAVAASVTLVSGKPDYYLWDWGLGGTPEKTFQPSATKTYEKGESARNQAVKVTAYGPGSCVASATASTSIPGLPVAHPWCKRWPYVVALLGSLACGGWLVCPAANADPAPSGWLPWVLLLLTLAFGLVAWLWQSLGKKRGCPPALCGGLAVGWTIALTMTGVAFFLNDCLPSWMGWGIGSFLVAAILAGIWYWKCAKTAGARVFITFFLISLLAFAIIVLALAMPALACV